MGEMSTLVFDRHCPLCRALALVASDELPSHWRMLAWQDLGADIVRPPDALDQNGRPRELAVIVDGQWLVGEEAWLHLVTSVPRLQAFQNLAYKLGISPPRTARWLRLMGHGLRNICGQCPFPKFRK